MGFGAVVVEAGVEALEGFRVVKPQDGTSQQGKHLASAGFLARTRGVFIEKTLGDRQFAVVLFAVQSEGFGEEFAVFREPGVERAGEFDGVKAIS